MDSHWLEALVKKFDKENRISSIVSIEIDSAAPKGENYASVVSRGSMAVVLGSGRQSIRRIIIKESKTDPKMKELMKTFNIFKCETNMYKNVLGQMEGIMNEYGDAGETLWPAMLGYKAYTHIVLDDLSINGFKVAERRECLDLNHGLVVVRSLAQFHALSKILIDRGNVGKEDLSEYWACADTPISRSLLEGALRQFSHSMINSWPSQWKSIGSKIQAQIPVVVSKSMAMFDLKEEGFHVVCHGDLWTCNIMFKYSPFTNEPVAIKFIDFQTCHYNSYIFDFLQVVYSSVIPEIRRKHLDEIFSAYQKALEFYLKSYNYQGKIPDLNHIKAEYQRAIYWAFIQITVSHPVTTADTSEAFDPKKIIPDQGETHNFINPEVLKSEKLINNIGPDLEMFAEKCVI